MKRSRLVGIALVLALVGSAAPAPAQTEPDWASLGYFQHTYGGWMRIWTNENTFDKGVRKINGDTSIFGNPYPGYTPEQNSTEFQVLWDERCETTKAQTFKTTREIYVMGAPQKLQASLGAYSDSLPDGKKSPVTRVELVINGTTVHEVKATKSSPIPYLAAQRTIEDITDAPLRYGLNTITVIGHKKKTKKSLGWCTGDNYFGVLAEVYGEFLADMSATHVSFVGSAEAMPLDVTVKNNGPSTLYQWLGHTLGISAVSGNSTVLGVDVIGIAGCLAPVRITGSKQGYGVSCPLPRMEPGDSFTVRVIVRWDDAPVGSTTDISYSAEGYGEYEPAENANDGKTFTVTTVEDR